MKHLKIGFVFLFLSITMNSVKAQENGIMIGMPLKVGAIFWDPLLFKYYVVKKEKEDYIIVDIQGNNHQAKDKLLFASYKDLPSYKFLLKKSLMRRKKTSYKRLTL